MKKLILIGGPMGIGKTTVGEILSRRLSHCAFLDGDWCWTWRPDCVNGETKALVLRNIRHMLRGYLESQTYENVVFVWVMHEQAIWDDVLSGLDGCEYELHRFVLTAGEAAFRERFMKDVDAALRRAEDLPAAYARMALYDAVDAPQIATDGLSAEEVADRLMEALEAQP